MKTFDDRSGKAKASEGHKEYGNPEDELMPCSECHGSAPRKVLVMFGSLCSGCYERYRNRSTDVGVFTHQEKRAIVEKIAGIGRSDSKAWAHILKAREKAGDRLSSLQRRMWREALREQ